MNVVLIMFFFFSYFHVSRYLESCNYNLLFPNIVQVQNQDNKQFLFVLTKLDGIDTETRFYIYPKVFLIKFLCF